MPAESRKPRLIPVLDVMGGQVVRAVAGRRENYRPVVSTLTDSTEPLAVARALLETTGAEDLYVADLDAIRGSSVGISPAVLAVLEGISDRKWLDVGLRFNREVEWVPLIENMRLVVASETAADLSLVGQARPVNADDGGVAFSIDLDEGVILGRWPNWCLESPRDVVGLAARAIGAGANALILLDLAAVGTREGPRTVEACRSIRAAFPNIELVTGGGVRSWDDIDRLGESGADAVLVASALHDGTLKEPRV